MKKSRRSEPFPILIYKTLPTYFSLLLSHSGIYWQPCVDWQLEGCPWQGTEREDLVSEKASKIVSRPRDLKELNSAPTILEEAFHKVNLERS